jgi:hypothetical protein
MDQVFTGIMRYTSSFQVLSTPNDVQLGTAGPAIIALRGVGDATEIKVKMKEPGQSKGGNILFKCARSSSSAFRLEDGTLLSQGDWCLVACDGMAWYNIQVGRAMRRVVIGEIEPGEILDFKVEVHDVRVEASNPIIVGAESSHSGLLWTEPLTVINRKVGEGFEISGRVKNSLDTLGRPLGARIILKANYQLGESCQ